MKLKLHAGQGLWFSLFNNGTMYFEGNKTEMVSYLKKHTSYSNKTIENLMDRSFTEWVDIKTNESNVDKIRKIVREEIQIILKK